MLKSAILANREVYVSKVPNHGIENLPAPHDPGIGPFSQPTACVRRENA
jgi:hypothetical protein